MPFYTAALAGGGLPCSSSDVLGVRLLQAAPLLQRAALHICTGTCQQGPSHRTITVPSATQKAPGGHHLVACGTDMAAHRSTSVIRAAPQPPRLLCALLTAGRWDLQLNTQDALWVPSG